MLSLILLNILIMMLGLMFFMISNTSKKGAEDTSSFECGFNSTFENRFSFSVHYYIISLIFLLLDMELCLLIPFFLSPPYETISFSMVTIFVAVLLGALMLEWQRKKLDWTY